MKLASYLDEKLVFVNLKSKEKDEAILEMIKKAAKEDHDISERKDLIIEKVLEREHEISTVMGKGIAIPHARIQDFDDVIVLVGVLENEIKCENAAKLPDEVKLFFMIIAGQTKNKIMLKMMSSIMKLAAKKDILEGIKNAKDGGKLFNFIDASGIEVENRITAEDIMNSEIEPVSLDTTLEDVVKRFTIENLRGIPVVDKNGKFLGEITERELIEYGMPKYTSLMNDLSFMTVGEPFEAYFKNEHNVTVKELYRKDPPIIDKNASIMEVSFEMVTRGKTRIYVVENGKFLGIILRNYIIKKVLHI